MAVKDMQTAARRIDLQRQRTHRLRMSYAGKPGTAFMSKDAAEALNKKLGKLYVNFPRLVVHSLAERCRIASFRRHGDDDSDMTFWDTWRAAGMEAKSDVAIIDRLLYGQSFVTIWGQLSAPNRPAVMVDTPRTMTVDLDPATGEVRRAFRIWKTGGKFYGAEMSREHMQRYQMEGEDTQSGRWSAMGDRQPNPWGRVPVVPFIRRASSSDVVGVSAATDVLDLTDALAKLLQDSMVTSEYYARPRRWATGLEIEEDDDGEPIDPFGENRLMQSEDPETKFGQLPASSLNGYTDLSALFTQQVGTLTGLPPHYLGLHGDQPPNADAVRASETQLVSRAYSEMRGMSQEWAEVAGWMDTIAHERPEWQANLVTEWESPETRTESAATDSAAKLWSMGVPLRSLLRNPLRRTPQEIDAIMQDQGVELAQRMAFSTPNTPDPGGV